MTTTLNWLVRVTSDLESNVVAVERLEEFSHLEPEAAWDTDTALPGGWPGHGEISLEDYSTRCGERERVDDSASKSSIRIPSEGS